MNLVRLDPFSNMISLRDVMDRLFEDSFVRPSGFWSNIESGELPVNIDIYQTDTEVVLKAALPGVKPDEVDIFVTGDVLTIKGEHTEEQELKEKDYMRREQRYGTYSRSIQIPVSVENDKVEAVFEDGILTLRMPKAEELKPKQVKIKSRPMVEGEQK